MSIKVSRGLAYMRVGTQTARGAEMDQIRALSARARCGQPITALVVDFAQGEGVDRPGLRHLLGLVERGFVKQIVVRDLSRLARSRTELARLLDRLDRLGVRVTVASESVG